MVDRNATEEEGDMSAQAQVTPKKVTRDDIEAKLRELRGEVDTRAQSAKGTGVAIVAGVVMVTIITAYVLGRRRGKKRNMVLEIRRI
jgi:hypothetical protein